MDEPTFRVLLVEDSPTDAFLVREILATARGSRFTIAHAEELRDALAKLRTATFDVVLLDLGLPDSDGLETFERLHRAAPGVPIMILSGRDDEAMAIAAVHAGAEDYLVKGPGGETGLARAIRYAIERWRAKETIAAQARQQAAVATLGRLALAGADVEALFQEAMTLLAQTLEVEFGRVLELQASGEKLLLRAGIGWRDGLVGRATIDADAEEQAGFTLQGDGPVVVEDLGAEARFAAALLREHGVVSGVTVLIQGRRKPWGVLGAHTARRRAFGQHEVAFLQTMAHVLGEAIERKATEAALHESDARFHQVVENVAEALWMFEPETKRVVYVSPRYAEIWGRTGPSVDDAPPGWHESIHPDDRAAVQKAAVVRERAEGESQTYRIVRPDGAVRWIRHRTFAARDEAGKVRRLIAVAEDTTEQKKLEEQFLRAQRMEAIGTLAGGVAHDLNNMLTPVLMTADLLTERLGDERDRRLLAVMARSAQRAADTVKQLLLFSRGAEGARTLVQCQQLLKEMVAIMRETFPREITIVEHPASDLRPVVADATHLHQVLMNLCVNARDAMPNGGTLTVGGTNVELGPRDLHLHADARCGRYTVLTVADTGRGIPPEISNRIFDPFFTTKEVGRGSGLGLSTAVGILRSHGGFITVWSESGRGTVFRCHLPAAGQSALAALPPPATPALAPAGSGEVILVVDDEEPVREAIREILELNKYRVLLAADGREAMGRFLEQRENVRLVLTDLMMPVMNGAALVRALRALAPRLKVIAMSGLAHDDKRMELAALGVAEILQKPWKPAHLLAAVQRQIAPAQV